MLTVADEGPIVSGIAGRYASALYELASETGAVDAVEQDLARFGAMVAGNPDLARLVKSPAFSAEEQSGALAAVLERVGIAGLAGNFLKVLAAKRRLFAVEDMTSAFSKLADRGRGIVPAQVTVAEPLSERNRAAVAQALAEMTGRQVRVEERVDPAIIGGIVVKLGSRMVDASLRTKLNAIRLAMRAS